MDPTTVVNCSSLRHTQNDVVDSRRWLKRSKTVELILIARQQAFALGRLGILREDTSYGPCSLGSERGPRVWGRAIQLLRTALRFSWLLAVRTGRLSPLHSHLLLSSVPALAGSFHGQRPG